MIVFIVFYQLNEYVTVQITFVCTVKLFTIPLWIRKLVLVTRTIRFIANIFFSLYHDHTKYTCDFDTGVLLYIHFVMRLKIFERINYRCFVENIDNRTIHTMTLIDSTCSTAEHRFPTSTKEASQSEFRVFFAPWA